MRHITLRSVRCCVMGRMGEPLTINNKYKSLIIISKRFSFLSEYTHYTNVYTHTLSLCECECVCAKMSPHWYLLPPPQTRTQNRSALSLYLSLYTMPHHASECFSLIYKRRVRVCEHLLGDELPPHRVELPQILDALGRTSVQGRDPLCARAYVRFYPCVRASVCVLHACVCFQNQ